MFFKELRKPYLILESTKDNGIKSVALPTIYVFSKPYSRIRIFFP